MKKTNRSRSAVRPGTGLRSFLGPYWMVIVGSGVALVVVVASLTAAVLALKAKEPAENPVARLPQESAEIAAVPILAAPPAAPISLPRTPDKPVMKDTPAPPTQPVALPDLPAAKSITEITKKDPAPKAVENCDTYGTKVHFQPAPAMAFKKALADNKLVFILHVSGNFEDPQFT